MTTIETREIAPTTYTRGLGEIIRAHRLYIGLSQREMAERLGKDRRDYQRIETGRDWCPPGLLSQIEELSDQFHHEVTQVLDAADDNGGLTLSIIADGDPENEWDRLVAGRAAVEASADAPINLLLSGNTD